MIGQHLAPGLFIPFRLNHRDSPDKKRLGGLLGSHLLGDRLIDAPGLVALGVGLLLPLLQEAAERDDYAHLRISMVTSWPVIGSRMVISAASCSAGARPCEYLKR